jgi:hypothetical protein
MLYYILGLVHPLAVEQTTYVVDATRHRANYYVVDALIESVVMRALPSLALTHASCLAFILAVAVSI